jgi:hypothetical protein
MGKRKICAQKDMKEIKSLLMWEKGKDKKQEEGNI